MPELKDKVVAIPDVYPGKLNTPILGHRPTPVSQAGKDSIVQPDDIAVRVSSICRLPPRAHLPAIVPAIVIKPTTQQWV